MSTLPTTRASHQRHNGAIKLNNSKKREATAHEQQQLNAILATLRNAKEARNETQLVTQMRGAFLELRSLIRNRIQ